MFFSIVSKKIRNLGRGVSLLVCMALLVSLIGCIPAKAATQSRYIVLVVDTSGESNFLDPNTREVIFSAVSPIDEVKQAALQFAESLSQVPGTYVSIVSYNTSSSLVLDFTDNINLIKSTVNSLRNQGGDNW